MLLPEQNVSPFPPASVTNHFTGGRPSWGQTGHVCQALEAASPALYLDGFAQLPAQKICAIPSQKHSQR
jgi:hypothetical protein